MGCDLCPFVFAVSACARKVPLLSPQSGPGFQSILHRVGLVFNPLCQPVSLDWFSIHSASLCPWIGFQSTLPARVLGLVFNPLCQPVSLDWFSIHSASPCLWIGLLRPFALNIIIERVSFLTNCCYSVLFPVFHLVPFLICQTGDSQGGAAAAFCGCTSGGWA
ncbi:hypothetical protein H1C71_038533 [Ictidomys tridecemlineatus]|nr:hypothetical protein H1C71_038533 [Ictidomys tridecemlineatus]